MSFKAYQFKKMDDTSSEKAEYLCCRRCEHVLEYERLDEQSIVYYCGNTDCAMIKVYTDQFAIINYSEKEVAAQRSHHVNYN